MSNSQNTAYSPKEVAQQLGFCNKTVLKLVRDGKIAPVYRVNKRVLLIPPFAVERFLARRISYGSFDDP